MCKQNNIGLVLAGLFAISNLAYAGGDDRDLGPVEVLDIIVQEKIIATPKPVKAVAIKAKTNDLDIDEVVVDVKKTNDLDIDKVIVDVEKTNTPKAVEVIKVKKPVVVKKVVKPVVKVAKPVVVKKVLKPAVKVAKPVVKVVKPKPVIAVKKIKKPAIKSYDMSSKKEMKIGEPTAPVKDLAPGIKNTCLESMTYKNTYINNVCIAILGVFLIL